jgi:hypothetical protein
MKKLLIVIAGLAVAASAYASCRYYTYMINGQVKYCTECCYGNNCTVTCN